MKNLVMILLITLLSTSVLAGGGAGSKTVCNASGYKLKIDSAADGIGALNPFDWHKDVFTLKSGRKKLYKEEYTLAYDSDQLDKVAEAASYLCDDVPNYGHASDNISVIYCRDENGFDLIIAGWEDEVIAFTENDCE